MRNIMYRFYTFVFKLVGHIPLFLMYLIANVLNYVLQYIVRYRLKVIDENLALVFPDKSIKERKQIRKKYYKHLADFIVEVLVCSSISSKVLSRRIKFVNPELINKYYDQGRQVVAVLGHYANWEWTYCFPEHIKHKTLVVYKPLDNKIFDQIFKDVRSRFSAEPVSMEKSFRTSVNYIRNNEKLFLYLLADQSPAGSEKTWYFTNFLGVSDTPVFLGPEKIAQSFDAVFIFADIQKVKRGHYELRFETLCENTKDTAPFELTQLYIDRLESQIRAQPAYWIWSHRRWKRRKKQE